MSRRHPDTLLAKTIFYKYNMRVHINDIYINILDSLKFDNNSSGTEIMFKRTSCQKETFCYCLAKSVMLLLTFQV